MITDKLEKCKQRIKSKYGLDLTDVQAVDYVCEYYLTTCCEENSDVDNLLKSIVSELIECKDLITKRMKKPS